MRIYAKLISICDSTKCAFLVNILRAENVENNIVMYKLLNPFELKPKNINQRRNNNVEFSCLKNVLFSFVDSDMSQRK